MNTIRNIFMVLALASMVVMLGAQEALPVTPKPVTMEDIQTIKRISADEVQMIVIKWAAVLTTIVSVVAALAAHVLAKVNEVRARVVQQNSRMDNIQNQVTTVALNQPPPANPTLPPPANPSV